MIFRMVRAQTAILGEHGEPWGVRGLGNPGDAPLLAPKTQILKIQQTPLYDASYFTRK